MSRAHFNVFTCLGHMDVRAGMKDHHARLTPTQKEALLENQWKGRRDAKKKKYAATLDEQERAARALEEQAPIEQREKELLEVRRRLNETVEARAAAEEARAEARAAEEKARADALAALAERTALTEEETAALREGGRVGYFARRAVVARATDEDLEAEGPAGVKKAKRRQDNRGDQQKCRKRKKEKAEVLALEEAQLTEECVALMGRLGCGGSPVLDDDDAVEPLDMEPFREDEDALQDLVDAKDRGEDVDVAEIKKQRKNLNNRIYRARKKAKEEKDQQRVKALTGRVEELEKEVCLLEDALSLI